ncbi:MAG: 2OG-Fe(II) oxygenase [Egibacteraceae bacterium]
MVRTQLLERLGVFVAPGFLDRERCEALAAEMLAAGGDPATVTVALKRDELAERYRRTTIVDVSEATRAAMQERIESMRGELAERFAVSLGPCEKPQFLHYRTGDFIARHSDGSHDGDAPEWLRRRAVAVLVYLNDQSESGETGTFGGGALTFYELLSGDPRAAAVGLPLSPSAGLMVAFAADVVHEVTEITAGNRFTAVTWFPEA